MYMLKSSSILSIFTWSVGKGRSGWGPCSYSVVLQKVSEDPASSTDPIKTFWPSISIYSKHVISCCYGTCFPSTKLCAYPILWGRVVPFLQWCGTWVFLGGGEGRLGDGWQMFALFVLSLFLFLAQIVVRKGGILGCWGTRSREREQCCTMDGSEGRTVQCTCIWSRRQWSLWCWLALWGPALGYISENVVSCTGGLSLRDEFETLARVGLLSWRPDCWSFIWGL